MCIYRGIFIKQKRRGKQIMSVMVKLKYIAVHTPKHVHTH